MVECVIINCTKRNRPGIKTVPSHQQRLLTEHGGTTVPTSSEITTRHIPPKEIHHDLQRASYLSYIEGEQSKIRDMDIKNIEAITLSFSL